MGPTVSFWSQERTWRLLAVHVRFVAISAASRCSKIGDQAATVGHESEVRQRLPGEIACFAIRNTTSHSCTGLAQPMQRSARVKPFWQERIRVQIARLFKFYAALAQKRLQTSLVEGVECFGAPTEVMIADEDLWNGRRVNSRFQHVADLAAPIALLVVGGIEIDRPVGNVESLEQLAHGPAELAPFEGDMTTGWLASDVTLATNASASGVSCVGASAIGLPGVVAAGLTSNR